MPVVRGEGLTASQGNTRACCILRQFDLTWCLTCRSSSSPNGIGSIRIRRQGLFISHEKVALRWRRGCSAGGGSRNSDNRKGRLTTTICRFVFEASPLAVAEFRMSTCSCRPNRSFRRSSSARRCTSRRSRMSSCWWRLSAGSCCRRFRYGWYVSHFDAPDSVG